MLASLRHAFVDRLAGALQGAVDRWNRGLQGLRCLLGGEAEHVAEDEHGSLARREVL